MFATPLRTAHLTIIPASSAHVRAELSEREAFATLLNAAVPASWPPGEYDPPAQRFFLDCLTAAGEAGVGWYNWYAIRDADAEALATVVAGGGYFGPPTEAGIVEIGYSVCPEWRAHGYATELATELAARHPDVTGVVAHTAVTNPASVRVLERSGFVAAGPGAEPGMLRFEYAGPKADTDVQADRQSSGVASPGRS